MEQLNYYERIQWNYVLFLNINFEYLPNNTKDQFSLHGNSWSRKGKNFKEKSSSG